MAFRAAAARLVLEKSQAATEADERVLFDAGAGLRSHVLGLYKRGEMSAAAVCTLRYHACNAGARGVNCRVWGQRYIAAGNTFAALTQSELLSA